MLETLDDRSLEIRAELLGSLITFIKVFYKLLNGREFVISEPIGRESHQRIMCRELTKTFRGETQRLLINVPPGHGKSTILSYFVAWCFAHYGDCQFLYISYSQGLAAKHTAIIKKIMELPYYQKLFDVHISKDSSAKDDFKTTKGGAVKAFGSSGGITGQDAGLPNVDRFSGAAIMDDMHKPDEVHSDTIREGVIDNYKETIKPRPRSPSVPIIFIGQRLHEGDLPAYFIESSDGVGEGYNWRKVILKALDDAGNVLHPKVHPREMLLIEEKTNPYVFASQYQQNPQPAGGGIFKPEWFQLMDEDPKILASFITADTAETDKNYNDATVFSFWGLYKIMHGTVETDVFGLHWIDCIETRIEPKDLQPEFMQFYADCMRYKVKPNIVAIEKKSTGVTLSSTLKTLQGFTILDIDRTKASGSKIARYFEAQPYVASRRISLTRDKQHAAMCIEHCRKITANNSHRFADIADTMYDGIKIGLIDKIISFNLIDDVKNNAVVSEMAASFNRRKNLMRGGSWRT